MGKARVRDPMAGGDAGAGEEALSLWDRREPKGVAVTFALPSHFQSAHVLALRHRLAEIAACLGYHSIRGPLAGSGSVGRMLVGLARGDVIPLRLSEEERQRLLAQLQRLRHRDETGIFSRLIQIIEAYQAAQDPAVLQAFPEYALPEEG